MLYHRVNQCFVVKSRVAETQFGIGRAFLAQQFPRGDAGALDQLLEQGPRRRRLQIFYDMRLDAGIADQRERVARRPASGLW